MAKLTLPFIETMITQVCNLSCLGCTNYSDLHHKGYITWEEGQQHLQTWLTRININDFGIMGGEPLLNPQVEQWINGIRELLPQAQIRFTTNGILLEKKFHVVEQLSQIGNAVLKITVHEQSTDIEQLIEKIFNSYAWEPVTEYGIARYKTSNQFRFQINRPTRFLKTYKNDYHNMAPHDNLPYESFKICCQQTCPLLYRGKLYKCSTAGLLKDTLNMLGNPNIEQWQPYIDAGIGPDCDNLQLQEFIDNFGQSNSLCRMCPSEKDIESMVDHTATVSRIKIHANKIIHVR